MPVQTDFPWTQYSDGTLVVTCTPPVALGGADIRWRLSRRFGSESGLIPDKYLASGFNGTSGISITNSGQGIVTVIINSQDTSGLDYGVYAVRCDRITSGQRTALAEGYMLLGP